MLMPVLLIQCLDLKRLHKQGLVSETEVHKMLQMRQKKLILQDSDGSLNVHNNFD